MNKIQLFSGMILVIILAAGCAGIPSTAPQSEIVDVGLAGPVWLLAGYLRESGFVPLEPGHGTTARIVFRENGSFEGTTGWSLFSGTWSIQGTRPKGITTARFYPATFKSSASSTVAEQFEQDVVKALRNTRSVIKGVAAVRFLDASGQPLLDFISSNPAR